MSNTPTRNVALTKELEAYIQAQVASGRYGNASEVVRSALRFMIERDDALAHHRPSVKRPVQPRVSA